MIDIVEQWARAHFKVVELDSVAWTYSGDGPPSWRMARPEIDRPLAPANPGDWWHMLRLADFLSALSPDAQVLDLGCGPGWPAIPLSAYVAQITAVDASDLALTLIAKAIAARRICNVRLQKADAVDLPFDDGTFDAVITSDLIDVVPDPARVACEMFRVLRPGGRFVSGVQNFRRVLGRPAVRRRSFQITDCEAAYVYHHASLSPAGSMTLRFHLSLPSAPHVAASVAEGTRDVDADAALQELQALRAAIGPEVHVYRAPEFVPETAPEPFAAAGFSDLTVMPLNVDACMAFSEELARSRDLPGNMKEFQALAAALLCVMPHTDPDKSWNMSVKGAKPSC